MKLKETPFKDLKRYEVTKWQNTWFDPIYKLQITKYKIQNTKYESPLTEFLDSSLEHLEHALL